LAGLTDSTGQEKEKPFKSTTCTREVFLGGGGAVRRRGEKWHWEKREKKHVTGWTWGECTRSHFKKAKQQTKRGQLRQKSEKKPLDQKAGNAISGVKFKTPMSSPIELRCRMKGGTASKAGVAAQKQTNNVTKKSSQGAKSEGFFDDQGKRTGTGGLEKKFKTKKGLSA